jgi:hypothetical protein
LQRLLASHPQIKTGQESRIFEYIEMQFLFWDRDLSDMTRGGTGLPCYLTEDEFVLVQKKFLVSILSVMLKGLQRGEIFLEKTPAHSLLIPQIIKLLPQAKFLHLVRDPRDVIASMIAASKDWGTSWAPRTAPQAARKWAQHVNAVEKAAPFVPTGQFLEISYEDLFREPLFTLREIVKFLNLSWSDEEITRAIKSNDAEELRKENGTPIPVGGEHGRKNSNRVREPENFIRKARPGAWREDLTLFDRLQIEFVLRRKMPDWKKFARA